MISQHLAVDLKCLKFTLGFPLVDSDETHSYGRDCIICKKPYGRTSQSAAQNSRVNSHGAHIACPICNVQFPELIGNLEGVSDGITISSWHPYVEAEAKNELEQLENDTGLDFVSDDASLEATLSNGHQAEKGGVQANAPRPIRYDQTERLNEGMASKASGVLLAQGHDAIASLETKGKRKILSRPFNVARAAVKAVNFISKRSG